MTGIPKAGPTPAAAAAQQLTQLNQPPALRPPAPLADLGRSQFQPPQPKPVELSGGPAAPLADPQGPMLSLREVQFGQGGASSLSNPAQLSSAKSTGTTDSGVTVTNDGVEAEQSREWKWGPFTARLTATEKLEVTEPRAVPGGGEQQVMTVEGSVEASAGAEVSRGPYSVGLELNTGERLRYQVVADPATMEALQADGATLPDPLQPETIPEGATVIITSEHFRGHELTLGYGGLQAELGYSESEGMAFSVENLGGGTMRVTGGPTEAVQQDTFFGVDQGPVRFGIGGQAEVRESRMVQADFNMNTDEGREAYADFIATGDMPQENPPHVTNVRVVEQVEGSGRASVEASIGGYGFKLSGDEHGFQTRFTTNPATGETQVEQFARNGDTSMYMTVGQDAQGNPTGEASYTLVLDDLDSPTAELLGAVETGTQPTLEGDQNVELKLTEGDLLQVREQSLLFVGERMDPQVDDPREVERILAEHPEAMPGNVPPMVAAIALTPPGDAGAVATAIIRTADNKTEVGETLTHLADEAGQPLPGELTLTPSSG